MHENLPICEVDQNKFIKKLRKYTIAWFVFVWLQFVFQFDEEVIVWTCNGLQKICQTVSNAAKKITQNFRY